MNPCRTTAILILLTSCAFGDGGAILTQGAAGPWRVTLFVPATPLYAGKVDVSVLLQQSQSGEPVLDANVTLHLPDRVVKLSRDSAVNRILYAGVVSFHAGSFPVTISICRGNMKGHLSANIVVQSVRPPITGYLLCFAVVPVTVLVYAILRLRQ